MKEVGPSISNHQVRTTAVTSIRLI